MSIPTISHGASTLMGRTVLARFLFLSVCWQVSHTLIWNSKQLSEYQLDIIMSQWHELNIQNINMSVPNPLHPWWYPASSTCSGSCGPSSFGPDDDRCHWSDSRERSASSSQHRSPPLFSPLFWVLRSTACPLECRYEWMGHVVRHLAMNDSVPVSKVLKFSQTEEHNRLQTNGKRAIPQCLLHTWHKERTSYHTAMKKSKY